jgi:KDO2-lipid IV(A) lauroyltransferase
MSAKYKIEVAFFKGLLFLVKISPQPVIVFLGRWFGLFIYYLGVRRSVVTTNLKIAFGKILSHQELKKLMKKIYANAGSIFFEILLMKFIPKEELDRYIQIDGLDILDQALEEGRGVVLFGGHFDHWELLSAGIAATGRPIYGYAGAQKNSQIDNNLNEIRHKFGLTTISKSKTATRQMLRVLWDKKILGILGDLNVPHNNLFVDFFDKKAVFGIGAPTFTVMKKTPLLFIWTTREGALKHKGHIIRLNYSLSGDQTKDVQEVAQIISYQLETIIKKHPDQYFWFNQRWKTRPPDDQERIYS